jgi:hypothetical protein
MGTAAELAQKDRLAAAFATGQLAAAGLIREARSCGVTVPCGTSVTQLGPYRTTGKRDQREAAR